jgi:hypothetical protein
MPYMYVRTHSKRTSTTLWISTANALLRGRDACKRCNRYLPGTRDQGISILPRLRRDFIAAWVRLPLYAQTPWGLLYKVRAGGAQVYGHICSIFPFLPRGARLQLPTCAELRGHCCRSAAGLVDYPGSWGGVYGISLRFISTLSHSSISILSHWRTSPPYNKSMVDIFFTKCLFLGSGNWKNTVVSWLQRIYPH